MSEWLNDPSYMKLKEVVAAFKVTNDAAERSVKFGTDFTQVRTKNETHRQNILQSAELARRAFPRATKKCFNVSTNLSVVELLKQIDYDARPGK